MVIWLNSFTSVEEQRTLLHPYVIPLMNHRLTPLRLILGQPSFLFPAVRCEMLISILVLMLV